MVSGIFLQQNNLLNTTILDKKILLELGNF